MKTFLLWYICSSLVFSFSGDQVSAETAFDVCISEHSRCVEHCKEMHSTPKKDVWDNPRRESRITKEKRKNCQNVCQTSKESCMDRKKKLGKIKSNLETRSQLIQNKRTKQLPNSSPSLMSSNTKVYKWKDDKGILHITNTHESVPAEFRGQVEESILGTKESKESN